MKIIIEREFDSARAAAQWLTDVEAIPVGGLTPDEIDPPKPGLAIPVLGEPREVLAAAPEQPKKTRKPRSDAGQPRGPYKTSDGTQAPAPQGQAAGVTADSTAAQPGSSPAAVSNSAAPAASPAASHVTPPTAPAAAELTPADMREALKAVSTKHGHPACFSVLAAFNVDRITALKPEQFAEFKAYCAKVAAEAKAPGVA